MCAATPKVEVSPLEGLRTASPPKVLLVGFAEAKAEGSWKAPIHLLLQLLSPEVFRCFSPLPPKVDTENLWWKEAFPLFHFVERQSASVRFHQRWIRKTFGGEKQRIASPPKVEKRLSSAEALRSAKLFHRRWRSCAEDLRWKRLLSTKGGRRAIGFSADSPLPPKVLLRTRKTFGGEPVALR